MFCSFPSRSSSITFSVNEKQSYPKGEKMISNRIVVPFVIAISFLASFGNAGRSDAQVS
jgi:hypothetical protein